MRLESPSHDRAAVNRCAAEIALRLERLGARVSRIAGGDRADHVRAEFDGTGPQVLILGHCDTVWDIGQIGTHAACTKMAAGSMGLASST